MNWICYIIASVTPDRLWLDWCPWIGMRAWRYYLTYPRGDERKGGAPSD